MKVGALIPYRKPKFTGLAFLRSSFVTCDAGFPVICIAVAMWMSCSFWYREIIVRSRARKAATRSSTCE